MSESKQDKGKMNCEYHGVFETRKLEFCNIWTRCPKCEEIRSAEVAEENRQDEIRQQLNFYKTRLNQSGIPDRFKTKTLDTYNATSPSQKANYEFCKEYADNFADALKSGRSVIMVGMPGTGKTHLSVGIANHIMKELKLSATFNTVQRAIRRIKDTWNRGSKETETQAIESFTSPSLLILDEVGIQFGSDTEEQLLFDILNDRYENRKPTILISNLSKLEVFKYLGQRVEDRLREDSGKVLVFDWSSYRANKGETHDV